MSKFSKKYNFSAKGILYIDDGIISIENEETGELVPVSPLLDEFHGKEVTMSVAYSEELE